MNDFQEKVYELLKKIPKGKITTYKCLAMELGNRKLARAVGNALNKNPRPIVIPCHRVIRTNGEIGGYELGEKRKIELLKKEGIIIDRKKMVNPEKYIFKF